MADESDVSGRKGVRSRSVARVLLGAVLVSFVVVAALMAPTGLAVASGIVALLLLVVYLLWNLTRSVRELKRRVERIEEAGDGPE
ncbi:hypothetical protein BRD04_04740 [Halobacteriales archaeon QS_9_67_17]|nr:MAG: hypothetical protein BRD04_04740 [Halobacteriales archaeon QS_9_67_17]